LKANANGMRKKMSRNSSGGRMMSQRPGAQVRLIGYVLYVPAESVYAVFDVKQDMRRPHIVAAAEKAESVRRLKRTSVPVPFAAGTYKAKPLFEIVAGILCLES